MTLISIHHVGNEAMELKRHSLDWHGFVFCLINSRNQEERNLIKNLVSSTDFCFILQRSRTSGLSIDVCIKISMLNSLPDVKSLPFLHSFNCVSTCAHSSCAKIKRHLMRIVNSPLETILIFNFEITPSTRNGNALVSSSIKTVHEMLRLLL